MPSVPQGRQQAPVVHEMPLCWVWRLQSFKSSGHGKENVQPDHGITSAGLRMPIAGLALVRPASSWVYVHISNAQPRNLSVCTSTHCLVGACRLMCAQTQPPGRLRQVARGSVQYMHACNAPARAHDHTIRMSHARRTFPQRCEVCAGGGGGQGRERGRLSAQCMQVYACCGCRAQLRLDTLACCLLRPHGVRQAGPR